MTDGDIADSGVAGLPNSVGDTVEETPPMRQQSTDWPGGDTGKPPDSEPSSEPLVTLDRYEDNEAPLAPDASNLTAQLKDSPLVDIATTVAAVTSLFG